MSSSSSEDYESKRDRKARTFHIGVPDGDEWEDALLTYLQGRYLEFTGDKSAALIMQKAKVPPYLRHGKAEKGDSHLESRK